MKFASMMFAALMLLGVANPTHAGSTEAAGAEAMIEQPTAQSPPGKVAILSANLREGFKTKDQSNLPTQDDIFQEEYNCKNDMDPALDADGNPVKDCQLEVRNFADRILSSSFISSAPDVVLLQEVVHKSADRAASELTEKLGFQYEVAISQDPDQNARWSSGDETSKCTYNGDQTGNQAKYVRDTAILVNTSTMTYQPGGFITTKQWCSEVKESEKQDGRSWRQHAYLWVAEIPDPALPAVVPVEMSIANTHYVRKTTFVNDDNTEAALRWTNNIVAKLNEAYPTTTTSVVAGDFNAKPCPGTGDERPGCGADNHSPFWADLKNIHGYIDTVWHINDTQAKLDQQYCYGDDDPSLSGCQNGKRANLRIDYIFAREANICRADHDWRYRGEDVVARRAEFYSDHRFAFSEIGAAGGEPCGSQ